MPWLLLLLVLVAATIGVVIWRLRRRRALARLDRAMLAARDDALREPDAAAVGSGTGGGANEGGGVR
jgi:putative exporter of polyketide antibiotics